MSQRERECGSSPTIKIGTEDDPVDKLFEMEDLHVKLNSAGMSADSNTLYKFSFPPCLLPSTSARFGA